MASEPPERTVEPQPSSSVEHVLLPSPELSTEEQAELIAMVMSHPDVLDVLGDSRHRALYAMPGAPWDPASKEAPHEDPEVVVYDYTNDRWFSIPVDPATGEVAPFRELGWRDGFPMVVKAEVDEAVDVARADDRVQALLDDGFRFHPQPVRVGGWEGGGCVNARCVLVVLIREVDHNDAFAQVDLGLLRVTGILPPQ